MIRKAMLLSVCGLLVASAALASVPSPTLSTKPTDIRLVGSLAGVGDVLGQFTVVVRDVGGNTIANSSVVVDLGACLPDIKPAQTQVIAGHTTNCPTNTVRAFTDAFGSVTFRVIGSAVPGAFSTFNQGKIYADGVLLTPAGIGVATYDLDGASGVGGNDLSILANDFFAGNLAARSDLDWSESVGGNDLSLLAQCFFAGGSGTVSAARCP